MESFKRDFMNSVLILGASGLLGNALVDFLASENYTIGVISREVTYHEDSGIKVYAVNILDFDSLASVIKEYNTIINCTGQVTNPINECLLTNTTGMNNIVKAVKEYDKKLIHISSVAVYGTADYVNEESELNPQTPYGSIKCFAEFLIQSNLSKYTILRISNLFGINQKKGIINYLTENYLANTPDVHFNNNGNLKRYYIHTEDASSVIEKIMNQELTGIYNILGKDQFTIKELVANFEQILGYSFCVSYTNNIPLENINIIDDSKIKSYIEQKYKVSIFDYIKNLKL